MNFNPFTFIYNPPPTVSSDIPVHPASSVTGPTTIYSSTSSVTKENSLSSALITKLLNLAETSAYLQNIIELISGNISIAVNPASDPGLAQALNTLYGNVPPAISIAMYSNLLDTNINLQLTQAALGTDSTSQINQVQASALSTTITAVENSLSDSVTYSSQLPLLLGSLKTQAAMFTSMATNLHTYPIQQSTPTPNSSAPIVMSNIDMSTGLSDTLNGVVNDFSGAYAGVYQVSATVGVIADDVTNVVNTLVLQPLGDLIRVVALVNGAKGLIYKDVFKDLYKDLCNYVYLRLVADASLIVFTADKLTQIALTPLKNITGSLGQIMSTFNKANAAIGSVASGSVLGGLSKANSCCTSNPQAPLSMGNSSANLLGNTGLGSGKASGGAAKELNAMSSGIKEIASSIAWLQIKITSKMNKVLENFKKVLGRSLENTTSHTNLLCSLRSAEQLVTIATSLANMNTSNPSGNPLNTISSITQTVSLSSNSTSFVSTAGSITTSILGVPPPSTNVQSVLATGGLTQLGVPPIAG